MAGCSTVTPRRLVKASSTQMLLLMMGIEAERLTGRPPMAVPTSLEDREGK